MQDRIRRTYEPPVLVKREALPLITGPVGSEF
jgi:hypothetical protein